MIRKRSLLIGASALAAVVVSAVPASAHVTPTTYGTTYTAGVTNVFALRVPHSCADPDTVNSPGGTSLTSKIVVDVPAAVASVKPQFIPGWTLSTVKSGTGAVTQITWEASSAAFALPDTSYMDFGIRATLNGVAGDKIGLPTHQHCDFHENGTAATGLLDDWTGADTPTITLVGADKAVNTPAQVAEVKAKAFSVDAIAAQVAAAASKTALEATGGQVNFLIAVVNALASKPRGEVAAARAGSKLNVNVDLSAVNKGRSVDVLLNGIRLGSKTLNAAGDVSASFKATAGANSRIDIVLGGTVVATTTI